MPMVFILYTEFYSLFVILLEVEEGISVLFYADCHLGNDQLLIILSASIMLVHTLN